MKEIYRSDDPAIKTYRFRGLTGRYGHWPAAKTGSKRTFVVVYGQHASLERLLPIVKALQDFGDVYAVDNPGFGGMTAPHKIGEYPSLDFYAAHLAHFIENHIPEDRQLTMLGISYGFQMVCMLLDAYPELNQRTELAVSFVGFVRHTDLKLPFSYRFFFFNLLVPIGATRLGASILGFFIKPWLIRVVYFFAKPFNVKFRELAKEDVRSYIAEQIWLWTRNDHYTHAVTARDFYHRTDLTTLRIGQQVIHVGVPNDHLIDNAAVKKQLGTMYDKVSMYDLQLANHAPLDIDTPEKVHALLPQELVRVLRESANRKAMQ